MRGGKEGNAKGRAVRPELDQVEMAEMLGIDRSYLSEIETGKKDPSLRVLKTIADRFGLSLPKLLRRF
jgi:transcriptional regulator with XRE-family HTH domain